MTVWHLQGRREIPYGARPGVAMICASAVLVLALYPGPAEATMIDDGSRQAYSVSRDPFLFRPALSRVGLNADACGLVSQGAGGGYLLISGERTSARSEDRAGISNVAFPSAGRWFRDRDSRFGLEPRGAKLAWDPGPGKPSGPSSDARPPRGAVPDLGRIETRIENIGNCLNYMQYLLKTIGVIFSVFQGKFNTDSDRNVVSNPYTFVFMAAERSAANSPDSAQAVLQAVAVSQADVVSKYVPKFKFRNTLTTILDENRAPLTRNWSARGSGSNFGSSRADASSAKRRTPRRTESFKDVLKNFAIDIFSQAYTYVLMAVVLVFGLFLRSRV